VALAVLLTFLAVARLTIGAHDRRRSSLVWRSLRTAGDTTVATLRLIRQPGWRLAVGAPAYLLCDVAALWLCIHALGGGIPAAALLVAYLLGYLANAIPIPGGFGVLDGGLATALIAYHLPAATAVGAVLIYHALALWVPTISGTLAFVVAIKERMPPSHQAPDIARRLGSQSDGCFDASRRKPSLRHDDVVHRGASSSPPRTRGR
jgi:hypothetical protein